MIIYKNFKLIDVIDKDIKENLSLSVENGYIQKIAKASEIPVGTGDVLVDLEGNFIMPGMFNVHIHALSTPIANPASLNYEDPSKIALRGLNHLQQHLKSGVTFVRDMNGRKQVEVGLRDAIREKIALGPEYYVSGQCLTMTGGHGSNTGRECDGPMDCMKAAREQLKRGVDFIKVMATGGVMSPGMNEDETQLEEAEMAAAIREAHKVGKKTAVHAHGASGILNAVKAGIDSIEHGSYIDDECIELMLRKNTALVPTLAVDYFMFKMGKDKGIAKYALEKGKRAHEHHIKGFLKAWKAGVLIGVGTDAGTPFNPHDGTYMELVLMNELGVSPMDTIVAATINSAKIAGVDSWNGSISEGKVANFIVLEDNPLIDLKKLRNVKEVYLEGELVSLPHIKINNYN